MNGMACHCSPLKQVRQLRGSTGAWRIVLLITVRKGCMNWKVKYCMRSLCALFGTHEHRALHALQQVAVLEVHVAAQIALPVIEVALLALGHPCRAIRVLPPQRTEVRGGREHAEPDERDADGVAGRVVRRVRGGVRVRRDDAADVPERDEIRGAHAAPEVAREVRAEPADDDRHRRVHACRARAASARA
jgi:hypothetical protein